MTQAAFQKKLLEMEGHPELVAIPRYKTVLARVASELLNVPRSSLRAGRKGTHVLTRIDVSSENAKRKTYDYNLREIMALLIIRHQPKLSPTEKALRVYDRVA